MYCLLRLGESILRESFVEPGIGIAWVKLQGFVKADDSLFVATQAAENAAFVGPGSCMARVKRQGFVKAEDGLFGTTQVSETVAFVGPGIDMAVSYTHLRAHETRHDIVCRLLL